MAKRFFIRHNFQSNEVLHLGEEYAKEIKHIVKVMRLGVGAHILLANDRGQEAEALIEEAHKDSLVLKILSLEEKKRQGPSIVLLQAVIKGPKMDWLVEKSTEIGVDELCPILTEHTVAAVEEGEGRSARWQRIAESALKQSGAGQMPTIHKVETLTNAAKRYSQAWKFVLHPDSETTLLWAALKKEKEARPLPEKIVLCIGPEGGLSNEELGQLKQQGFQCVSLGQAILRGETAGVIASALVRHWIDFKG